MYLTINSSTMNFGGCCKNNVSEAIKHHFNIFSILV